MTGEELKAMRLAAGYKGKDFADILGINPNTLSRYELGRLTITPLVSYASTYICEQRIGKRSPGERLLSTLKEVLEEDRGGVATEHGQAAL